ncbi:uncharacterized protein BDR25DRAFT_214690 [Lindgomyces ingoldianus]|uniref:Uncharacterized protein n=1 Tax=Lindgomyces ingoldianus TaxID=673940 RepID=A0ACB6R6A6_9PLEO|nr:uncharacterized protein BDR25DRAFT_214690 [Lindgomyces ingoldianus]KAF2474794.1 hypothetical protein BDR25DRAFT_214690 [Lindgomyces ingoldianus]
MGRQAYLTRLALGRSAFEPSQPATASPEYVQLDSSQEDISTPNVNAQLYDERGHPINPRAREHGRRFREAQNDVLAAIGVVERRRSPSEGLPGAYELRIEQLENEESAGNAIAFASRLAENLCTWWLGSLRDRILTFQMGSRIPFTDIVTSEYRAFGTSLVYAGFFPRVLSTVGVQASVYAALVLQPISRLLFATRASGKTRLLFQRQKNLISNGFRLLVEIAFYPLAYHATLQRLALLPTKPLLPPWRAFVPFSSSSPIRLLSLPSALTAASLMEFIKSAISSPLVFVCLEHFLERWVYALVYEAIESTTIRPDRPDLETPDDGVKNRATQILGLRRKSPPVVRTAINKLLVTLGWGKPFPSSEAREYSDGRTRRAEIEMSRTMENNQGRVTNVSRLQIPMAHMPIQPLPGGSSVSNITVAPTSVPEAFSPASPTASQGSQGDNDDPRIRITSREGIVEMEVRLPPHVLSTHTEVSGTNSPTPIQRGIALSPADEPEEPACHRVTQLSTEPSQRIGAVLKAQIVGWATLPLKLITLRLIASHYIAGRQRRPDQKFGIAVYRGVSPLGGLRDFNLQSAGVLISRVALCGALEVAIDLSLWGCQWLAINCVGKKFFGWGTL